MNKKIIILVVLFVFALCGCSKEAGNVAKEDTKNQETVKDNEENKDTTDEKEEDESAVEDKGEEVPAVEEEEDYSVYNVVDGYNVGRNTHGYFANSEGTVKVSIAEYTGYLEGENFASGSIEAFGYNLLGEWKDIGDNKAQLVAYENAYDYSDEISGSALTLMYNNIIVDFGDGKDMSITVIINGRLKYNCEKIINYFEA